MAKKKKNTGRKILAPKKKNNDQKPQKLANINNVREKMMNGVVSFFDHYPLYYNILMSLARVFTREIPTMGVGFLPGKNILTLYYNPEFVDSLDDVTLRVVLNHECQHLGLLHLKRGINKDMRLFNVAADIIVNSGIPELKQIPKEMYDKICTYEKFSFLKDINIDNTTSEEIYDILVQERDKFKDELQKYLDDNGMDVHDLWQSQDGNNSDGDGVEGRFKGLTPEQEAAVDSLMKDAVNKLGDKNPGNVPGEMRRIVEEIRKVKLDWRKYLSIFAQTVAREDVYRTWKRVNRRYRNRAAGHKKDFRPKILGVIDNSGSIDANTYNLFISHMIRISEICDELRLIGVDTRVNFNKSLKRGKVPPELEEFGSGGGTDFQPAFDFAKEHEFDGIIYLTDGYASNVINTFNIPVIFGICPHGQQVHGFKNITIEE